MASTNVQEQALLDAISQLAKLAGDPEIAATYADGYASAARQLAEAYAWLLRPNQPHGGSMRVGD
jgi:hypothetical protein